MIKSQSMKKRKTILIVIGLIVSTILVFPFFLLMGPDRLRDFFYRELAYRAIVQNITTKTDSDREKALKIQDWIFQHELAEEVFGFIDQSAFSDFIRNIGFCDIQAKGVIVLAKTVGIKGKVTSLYGSYKKSHHSVAELEIDGKYRVFDAYHNTTFYNHKNELATFFDLQNKNIKEINYGIKYHETSFDDTYYKYYEPMYPPGILASTEYDGVIKKYLVDILGYYYDIFGNYFFYPVEKIYFMIEKTSLLKMARIKHLTFRYEQAIDEYTKLIDDKSRNIPIQFSDEEISFWDPKEKQPPNLDTVLFFRALVYLDMKDYKKCFFDLSELDEKYKNTRWRISLDYFLDYCGGRAQ